jgi:methyl-accepting chemotaxis protein
MLKLLRNVSIKVKILLGFFIVAMLVVATGILGTLSMESMAARTEKMYSSNLQSINELHMVKENLLNIRSELQKAVLYKDPVYVSGFSFLSGGQVKRNLIYHGDYFINIR